MNSVEGFVFIQRLETLCTPAAELCDAPQTKTLDAETAPSTMELHGLLTIPENVTTEDGSWVTETHSDYAF